MIKAAVSAKKERNVYQFAISGKEIKLTLGTPQCVVIIRPLQ